MTPIDARKLTEKPSCLLELLRTHHSVFVHVDSRVAGVSLPAQLMDRPQVALQLGLDLAVPIPDIDVSDEGWSATLSFGRVPHWCAVPWGAVYLVVGDSGTGGFWPGDCPPEAEIQRAGPVGGPGSPELPEKRNAKLPQGWGVIDGGKG